ADELRDVSRWSYRLTGRDVDELTSANAAFHRTGVPIAELGREHFPLKSFGENPHRGAPRADRRPRHRDAAAIPGRAAQTRGPGDRLSRARLLPRPHHAAEQAGPRAR